MELKIINDKTEFIGEKFGIEISRSEQLTDFVELLYYNFYEAHQQKKAMLIEWYQRIANFCNNIEEYTMCLHIFIFNIAKLGYPD